MEPENSFGVTTTTMDNRGRDCISELPDDLLHRILSFLDMTDVVTTSILSSRWRYLWISMPSFNFNQKVFQSCKTVSTSNSSSYSYRFVKFVDMVLQRKTSLENLVLSCDRDDLVGNEQVCRWIVDAVKLKVSVLELQLDYGLRNRNGNKIRPLTLPLCLFTCKTLTTLKFDFGIFSKNTLVLSFPDSVYLTGLKTLYLSSLFLIGEESTDSFFSRCPVLETLIIFNCEFKEPYKNNYLPSSILSCESLIRFELLSLLRFPVFSNVPDSLNLPSLKSLDVEGFHLFSTESNTKLFFSSCPSLESLILAGCKFHLTSDVLPRYIFTCKTLVGLFVTGIPGNTFFHIPDFVSLPCLKSVRLSSLCLLDGGITDNFFLGCPILERLVIFDCSITNSLFFWSKSLTKLELKMHRANGSWISIPDSMSLPALKTLRLESFLLNDEDSINDLLTRCPVLESLTIIGCAFAHVNLNVFSHKLSHLKLVGNKSVGCYVSNYASEDYGFKLNAPNLTSFICEDYMPNVYILENLSSIVKVDINFDMEVHEESEARSAYLKLPEGKKQLYARQMMKILGVLYNVKDLALSASFLEVVSGALDLPDSQTIQFCNLRCLKLITWRTMDCAHAVMYLLECSPNIENLFVGFSEIPSSFPFFDENPAGKDYWEEWLLLNCMLHHLSSVRLQDFSGCYLELKFVEFLLKNTVNLQKLVIRFTMIKDPMNDAAESKVVKSSEEKMEPENSSGISTTTTMDNRGGDRISELQDDLLHRILSLLDMKQVVQTSSLSSRWRYLWISMPSFNFNQKVFQSCKTVTSNSYRFVKFVDMVLQSKTCIEKFVLFCYSDYFVGNEQVYKWIADAVRLKVSVLKLQIYYDTDDKKIRPLRLPLCLFTCKTLTTLKIDFGLFANNALVLSLPDSVCLTALKTLHLSSLRLIREESTDSFFSRCPVLETLIIFNCKFEEPYKNNCLPSSIFSCKTLVCLKLMSWMDVRGPVFDNIPDSVNLPSLKTLHLKNIHLFSRESTGNLFFSSCPSLELLILKKCKLNVDSDVLPRYIFTCKTLVRLLVTGIPGDTLFRITDFVSLPCLKSLRLKSLRFFGGGITDSFFLSCPVLETLIISDCSITITGNFFLGCPVLDTLIVFGCSFTISHFFCTSLTKLVLDANRESWETVSRISLPGSMSLPALKTLHLKSFLLDDEKLITDIITRSPVLVSLIIMNCAFHRVNLNISSHTMRHLTLVQNKSGGCYVSDYASKDYEVKLTAPNLTSFICKDYMSKFYNIENLSSIVKVDINFDIDVEEEKKTLRTYLKLPEGEKQLYARQMMKILGVLYNVKDLTLSAWFLEVVFGALDLPDSPTIQFCNLRCLKLRTWRTMDCICIIIYLLEHSPGIESLSVGFAKIPISSQFFKKDPAPVDYWEERLSLQCMLHHLKSVELQCFRGSYTEVRFVEFLLKNAKNLQELMICFITMKKYPNVNANMVAQVSEMVVKVSEKVLSLPRASASVAILFLS